MRRHRIIILALVGMAGGACSSPTEPVGDGLYVRAGLLGDTIALTNITAAPAYYAILESGLSVRALVAICREPNACDNVPVGEQTKLPYTAISGYEPGKRQAVIYWWHLVPGPLWSLRADSIRRIVVDL